VLNRAIGRATIFKTTKDYAAFEKVLEEAREKVAMRVLAFCLMPNTVGLVRSASFKSTTYGLNVRSSFFPL
jgi:REP element-mobilizing transposase RayT